jgi:hypothetical protein
VRHAPEAAFIVSVAWLVGVLGLDDVGDLVHVLLLVGLMMLLLGTLKARDAAAHRDTESRSDKR